MSLSHKEYVDCLNRDLRQAEKSNLKLNAFFITKGCCKECDKLHGIELSLEEILKTKLLPYKNCTRESGCICCYGFHCVRDPNGRLIRKKGGMFNTIRKYLKS